MFSASGWSLIALTMFALCLSAIWTSRRYQNFDRLPVSFGFRGEARSLWPRTIVALLFPASLVLVLILAGFDVFLAPKGPPSFWFDDFGALLVSFCFLSSHALLSWLTHRWAENQTQP